MKTIDLPRPLRRYYELARREAEKSDHPKYKLGCVLVKGKKVLATGRNDNKTHPKWGRNPWGYLHAETNALYKAEINGVDVTGCDVYIYRKGYRLAKPCKSCYNALREAGVKNIFYTDHRVEGL